MTTTPGTRPASSFDDDLVLRLAAEAYLSRYTGTSRTHTQSDLWIFFVWCAEQDIGPLVIRRAQTETTSRWWQC